jgi:hypothetical protein
LGFVRAFAGTTLTTGAFASISNAGAASTVSRSSTIASLHATGTRATTELKLRTRSALTIPLDFAAPVAPATTARQTATMAIHTKAKMLRIAHQTNRKIAKMTASKAMHTKAKTLRIAHQTNRKLAKMEKVSVFNAHSPKTRRNSQIPMKQTTTNATMKFSNSGSDWNPDGS